MCPQQKDNTEKNSTHHKNIVGFVHCVMAKNGL